MCTGICLKGTDGTAVYGRTMEWGSYDLESRVLIVPRGQELTGSTPDGKAGAQWKSKHGLVGLDGLSQPFLLDGMNDKGLACGAFYLPGFAEYETYEPSEAKRSIGPAEVVHYILSQCATVDETREALEQIKVVPVAIPAVGLVLPLHYMVLDASGKSLVIEYVGGERNLYDDPLGVITNAPPFDWHLINLRNYVNLSPVAIQSRKLDDVDFAPLGAGSGMLGLPGDFTPPSRFIRAVAFTQTARRTKGGLDTVTELFRVLDNFNIGVGSGEGSGEKPGDAMLASTQWTTAADTRNLVYYYHTAYNRRVRKIDLREIDFGGEQVIAQPLDAKREEDVLDVTPKDRLCCLSGPGAVATARESMRAGSPNARE